MSNLKALLAVIVGLLALLVGTASAVKLIAIYLLLVGLLQLFSAPVGDEIKPARAPKEEPEAKASSHFPVLTHTFAARKKAAKEEPIDES